ncbi:MAG: hypothetical protein ACLP8A_07975 [Methylovirgula sp.]|jgi:hypothetical protein
MLAKTSPVLGVIQIFGTATGRLREEVLRGIWTDGFFGLRFAWEAVATERRASTDQDQEQALQFISIDDPPSNALLAILGVDLLALLTANPLYL